MGSIAAGIPWMLGSLVSIKLIFLAHALYSLGYKFPLFPHFLKLYDKNS
jgi:hypothetical protein